MKKFFLTLGCVGLLAGLLASCERPEAAVTKEEGDPNEIEVLFGIPSVDEYGNVIEPSDTKSTSASTKEETIANLTIVLFDDASGDLYKYGTATTNGVALKVVPGTYKVYALVNKTVSGFPAATTTISTVTAISTSLADNSVSSKFVMSGMETKTIAANTTTCAVVVNRHCCKVHLDKISVDFDGTALDGKSLRVDKVYIENAWKSSKFGPTNVTPNTTASNWFNLWGYVSNSGTNALLSDVVTGTTIADNASSTTKYYYYPYPNSSTTTTAGSGTDIRCSRLVLEATIMDGTTELGTYFYHVDLPGMVSNKEYQISELVIKNVGGPDPEHNNETASLTFSVSINSWANATGFPVTVVTFD